jgi:hypothetical protein
MLSQQAFLGVSCPSKRAGAAGRGGGQVLVEAGSGMGMELVLLPHDFLGRGVVGGQGLQKAAGVSARAPNANFDQALARARLEGGPQAGPALPPVRATFAAGAASTSSLRATQAALIAPRHPCCPRWGGPSFF